MKNERKTIHAFSRPRAIFDFVLFSSQCPKSSTMRGLFAPCRNIGPRWEDVFAAKKNADFLLFCDFVALNYKKNTEINAIKFKRSYFDKID